MKFFCKGTPHARSPEALRVEIADLEMRQQREILSLVAGQMTALMEGATRMTEANSRLYEGLGQIAMGLAAMLDR